MKKNRGDELIGVIILIIYMEISQGNFLCSCLYHKQAKMSFFSFLFFILQNWRCAEHVPQRSGKRRIAVWGDVVGKGIRRMNMAYKFM
jgi:hypothetical protein